MQAVFRNNEEISLYANKLKSLQESRLKGKSMDTDFIIGLIISSIPSLQTNSIGKFSSNLEKVISTYTQGWAYISFLDILTIYQETFPDYEERSKDVDNDFIIIKSKELSESKIEFFVSRNIETFFRIGQEENIDIDKAIDTHLDMMSSTVSRSILVDNCGEIIHLYSEKLLTINFRDAVFSFPLERFINNEDTYRGTIKSIILEANENGSLVQSWRTNLNISIA